ncbi:BspA family leucine-rich repeat surface protein [Flavobacteriaceae bacterium]|nr:BspA family leucine-rich repeat surface protein [Flavobacteriaceae bacterium]
MLRLILVLFLTTTIGAAQNFYLAPNGVTCMCPDAANGESGDPGNGVVYTKRNRGQITPQNAATTCTSGITDMSYLFRDVTDFNEDISSWDVSSVIIMQSMFDCYTAGGNFVFNQDLSHWDVSNVQNMDIMFRDCYVFNSDLSNWDTLNVTSMNSMFEFAYNFNGNISSWNVSNVQSMWSMFLGADAFNQPIGNWDVSNVTNMIYMFWGWDAEMSFDQDISSWQFNPGVSLGGFLSLSGMSTPNYDLLLESFVSQGITGRTLGADGRVYCNQAARENLINNGWNIEGDNPLEILFEAPNDLIISPEVGPCIATNVDLGIPEIQACPSYSLTNDAPTEFPLGVTQVNWTLVDGNGVTLNDSQLVEVKLETDVADICFVTSFWNDPTKNRIWITSDPNLNGLNVVEHEVLRENASGAYEVIGTIIPPENTFLDLNSNNNVQSYRYKLRTLNTCGEISEETQYHKTILLQSSISTDNSVNLSWNPYLGLSFSSYEIFRKINGGNWEQIASLSSTNTSYNDTEANVIDNFYEYYVAITVSSCNGNAPFQGFTLRSNFNYVNPNLSNNHNNLLDDSITIYPNPASEYLNILVTDDLELREVVVYNTLGQRLMVLTQNQINVSTLPSGAYYLSIETDQGRVNKTLLRE